MFKSLTSRALVSATLLALVALAPSGAMAREGAQSVGQGMKCYTAAVQQANGTVTYQRVCYKGV
jgi:hypothetical protein